MRDRSENPPADHLRLLEAHQADLREQIARLRGHENALAEKIATYQDDLAALQARPTRWNGK